jgi:hypothetical protein
MTDRSLPAGEQAAKRRGERQERALGPRAARVVGAALVVAMVIGALFMWIGVPVVWLWLASQLARDSQPSGGLYVFAGVGILLSMAGMGWLLARLNRMHVELTGRSRGGFVRRGWQRAEKGEHGPTPEAGVLDTIVVVSVVIALLALLVWFFFFAGSSINYQN